MFYVNKGTKANPETTGPIASKSLVAPIILVITILSFFDVSRSYAQSLRRH